MRTFARTQHQPQKQGSANWFRSNTAAVGSTPRTHPILHLQRTIGNQAVLRMMLANAEEANVSLASAASPRFARDVSPIPRQPPAGGAIPPKLAIDESGDAYEQEADRLADRVMRMPEPQLPHADPSGGACPAGQMNRPVQAPARLQAERTQAGAPGRTAAPSIVHEVLASPGQPLDPSTRVLMERHLGHDFSRVRVHADATAEQAASALHARAYTLGPRIVFGPGQYSPSTASGQRLIAHELAHVVQQRRAPAHGTTGVGVSGASGSAERAADAAAAQVMDSRDWPGPAAPGLAERLLRTAPTTPTLQRKADDAVDPFEVLRSGVRTATGGIGRARRFLRGHVRRGAAALGRLGTPTEDRLWLIEMVDDPALAHKRWKDTSFGGTLAVLRAMRARYGEDWTDRFLKHHASGSVRAEMESYGRAPEIETLEARGYALASAYPMTLDSSFERWVNPDGRSAQMVREHVGGRPLEAPPSGAELIEEPEPAPEPADEERELDMPYEELQALVPEGPVPDEREVRAITVEEHEDGSRTISVRTTTNLIYPYHCAPDDTCRAGVVRLLEPEE